MYLTIEINLPYHVWNRIWKQFIYPCPDPLMGILISGDSWINVYVVKYLSSLMLGEIENSVLNMAGGNSYSSVYEIFSSILNHENFTVKCNENILEIYLNNNPHINLS